MAQQIDISTAMIGQQIEGHRVVRLIGMGGMGAVFEGFHEQLGRRSAIKVLLPEFSRSEDMVSRFFTEARAVNIVRHPGIVSTYGLGRLGDGTVYIVMEYLEGDTLAQRLKRQPRCSQRQALRLCRQIASALAEAHKKGVIHRDLKPENVMIVPDPDVPGGERTKLLDFGLAKVLAETQDPSQVQTRTGIMMGTPRYMAPEQCRGVGGVGDRADVYSLGVILYQMLAGQRPFDAEGIGDLIVMQISAPPPPLQELAPSATPRLVTLVHVLLSKQPGQRPSMAELARELETLETGAGWDKPTELPKVGKGPQGAVPAKAPVQQDGTTPGGPGESMEPVSQSMYTGFTVLPISASMMLPKGTGPTGTAVVQRESAARPAAAVADSAERLPARRAGAVATPSERMPPAAAAAKSESVPPARAPRVLQGVEDISLAALAPWEDESSSVMMDRVPRQRGPLWVLLLGALLLGGTGLWVWHPLPRHGVALTGPQQDHEAEATVLLMRAEADLQQRHWEDAIGKAGQVLALSGLSPATRDLAVTRQEQARRERDAGAAAERFTAAVAGKDFDEAMRAYQQVPVGSPQRALIKDAYERAFPRFAAAHMGQAQAARSAGRCKLAREQIALVLAVEPRYPPAVRARAQSCEDDEDDDSYTPEPGVPLPRLPGSAGVGMAVLDQPAVSPVATPVSGAVPIEAAGGGPSAAVASAPPAIHVAEVPPPAVEAPVVVAAPPRVGPAAQAPVNEEDAPTILRQAQGQVSAGNPKKAMELARSLTRFPSSRRSAWLIIGTAACKLRDVHTVRDAYQQVDLSGAQFLVSLCSQNGVVLSNGLFRLAD